MLQLASLRQSPNADGSLVAQLQEQLEAVKGLLNEATTRNDALESETNQLQNEREELKLSLENEKKSFQEQLSASRKEYEKLQAVNEEVNVALTAAETRCGELAKQLEGTAQPVREREERTADAMCNCGGREQKTSNPVGEGEGRIGKSVAKRERRVR